MITGAGRAVGERGRDKGRSVDKHTQTHEYVLEVESRLVITRAGKSRGESQRQRPFRGAKSQSGAVASAGP